jgi:hypothetical protein
VPASVADDDIVMVGVVVVNVVPQFKFGDDRGQRSSDGIYL